MKKSKFILIIVFSVLFPLVLLSQGLKIQGNEFLIDSRTSFSVFDKIKPVFNEQLNIKFEIKLQNLTDDFIRGYILRIKNEKENTTYNILYKELENRNVFNFNYEGKDVLIAADVNKSKQERDPWISFLISFDIRKDSLLLKINDNCFYAGGLTLKPGWEPAIYFGRSEYVIDIPTYSIRNLRVGDCEKEYFFPLNESVGEEIHDSHKKVVGHVSNPDWLINDASTWSYKTAFHSCLVAGSVFNPDRREIYYANTDSILIYDIRTRQTYSRRYANKCPRSFTLGTNFIDYEKKRLYFYDVVASVEGEVTIAYLDLENYTWHSVCSETLPKQLHHHSSYFDRANRRYIIFGGFGNVSYNKEFYSFDLDKQTWSRLVFGGDTITPRYFSSMGYDENRNVLYLFGGMGNESGDQSVGRVYYYDLYKIDLNKGVITKLWEIEKPGSENMVPVRGLIVAGDSCFYTLCYPEHFSKSSLRLYCFSLKDGSYKILADTIPIVSEKITTHGNLYYSAGTSEFYSIVQEFEPDDIASSAKIYSISYPPVTKDELTVYTRNGSASKQLLVITFLLILILCAGGYLWIRVRMRKTKNKKFVKHIDPVPEVEVLTGNIDLPDKHPDESRPNAIYLFGDFSLIDRQNREINYMLSIRLKQVFFLILQHSWEKGITSQELSELLWPGKPEDKVKNSRGVTLNSLRKILSDLDGIRLVYEKGFFRIVFTEECYCDYWRCLEIISNSHLEQSLNEFNSILSRGKFLKSIDLPMLDSFKEMIESKMEPVLYLGMEKTFKSADYSQTLQFCESVFNIDPLNEISLWYMIRSLICQNRVDEAKKRYFLFVVEYRKTMGEDYPKSFTELADSSNHH